MRVPGWFLILETLFSYVLPACFWFWGLLTLPVWVLGSVGNEPIAIWNLISIAGGFFGAAGVIATLAQVISQEPATRVRLCVLAVLSACGVFSIWTMMTGHFHAFELNLFTLAFGIAPTLCSAHLLVLCAKLVPNGSNSEFSS